ncbi:pyridoxal phosphate-dependent deaminase, putative [hydrothermal vent metagenome]|uniref:Pyridoxal phosphate-dependent deaminase, putative n=1 Tax=hydrothermal vent metagenome TaxID=652676 RepID=A0A3B0XRU2_9ZZZZ
MTNQSPSRISLGFFPTPVVPLHNLGKILGGAKIHMKRDDNTGLALGGNKTRKLEFILADALAQGADTIITAGAIQSNHCRQTAAAAASLQLECHLVLGGQQPANSSGNLLLDQLFGSHIHWAGENRKGEDIPKIVEQLSATGKKVYIVPYGGSNEMGALAFIEALKELELQCQESAEHYTHIVFASSSGGTQAGLMLGQQLLNTSYQLVGINIDKDEATESPFRERVLSLANSTAKTIDLDYTFTEQDLTLNDNYTGEGYGIVGELEREAIALTAQCEGILLDPVYTGRAMGGLIDMIRCKQITKNDKVLFWHTGGAPALFSYPDSSIIQSNY